MQVDIFLKKINWQKEGAGDRQLPLWNILPPKGKDLIFLL